MSVRKLVLCGLAALALAAFVIGGLSRISFNVDVLELLPERLGTVTGLSLFAKHFARPTELIVTVEGADPDATEQAVNSISEGLRNRPELASRVVSASPWESRPEELAEFAADLLINQPPERFAQIAERVMPQRIGTTLDETKETMAESFAPSEIGLASYDPLGLLQSLDIERFAAAGVSEFANADGTFRVIYVEAPDSLPTYRDTIRWLKDLRSLVDALPLPPGVQVAYTGEPAFVAEISGQMERDMMGSGVGTILAISLIFWLCYRRFRPLLDLNLMLITTFLLSLTIAGWVLREITVIGVGFASIMIGLSVDYGYIVYAKSRTYRTRSELTRVTRPLVLWTSLTTAAAFFTLNGSSLPGLNQLGNLVAFGVLIGGVLMLGVFLPLTLRRPQEEPTPGMVEKALGSSTFRRRMTWVVAALMVVLLGALVVLGPPQFDGSPAALRMRHSHANDALERLYTNLTENRDLTSIIVTGTTETEVLERLHKLDPKIEAALAHGVLKQAVSPLPLWPDAAAQAANLTSTRALTAERERMITALDAAGFSDTAFALTGAIFDQWERWASKPPGAALWPENEASRWILRRATSREPGRLLALGFLQPAAGAEDKVLGMQGEGVHLVSWQLLGRELRRVIPREFALLMGTLLVFVLGLLCFAFRNLRDIVLMSANMLMVFLSLMGAMRLFGLDWNVFNIAAFMLLLGTGIDYSIYMLLTLGRGNGDVAEAQRSMGLVIFLCVASAVAGFGSLSWASHQGLASLGQVCALGLLLDGLITTFLLPHGWRWWTEKSKRRG